MKKNRKTSTYDRLDLETLVEISIGHWFLPFTCVALNRDFVSYLLGLATIRSSYIGQQIF